MTVRPYGIVVEGRLELGLEAVVEGGRILEIRPHTGIPERFVLSPGFVNAHSHLEYRGLQEVIQEREYWPWIRRLTVLKAEQDPDRVRADTLLAATENAATGVRYVEEHSDRPYAGEALGKAGLDGVIYQELITFFEQEEPGVKKASVERAAAQNRRHFSPVYVSPHSAYTVDEQTLRTFAEGPPFSIHVAETPLEREFFREGRGPIADLYAAAGFRLRTSGESVVGLLDRLGLVRPGAQFVHAGDVDEEEIARLAERRVRVAHCPRSNERLGCPRCPVRRLVESGVEVGLGMDSPASSGPIDFFAEMRAALSVSIARGEPLTPEQVWRLGTGALELSTNFADWVAIAVEGAFCTEDLLAGGEPGLVASAVSHLA